MTLPRPVFAGRTYFLSRRCTQRENLLQPDAEVEQIYEYCLAEAAIRFDVTVHGWMAMSNHQHLVVRDNRGNLPDFLAHLHKMLAKVLNAKWGRWENLWASEQPNVVHLVDPEDAFRKLIYLLANPVVADLVEHVREWPGASSLRLHLSRETKTIRRPTRYFREDGPMPEKVTLRPERLGGYEQLTDEEYSKKIQHAVVDAERAASRARAKAKRRVLGRKAVLRGTYKDRPVTREKRRGLRPLVACRDVAARVFALQALREFRSTYRAALEKWLGGNRRAVFPAGTFKMRQLGACCQDDAARATAAPSN